MGPQAIGLAAILAIGACSAGPSTTPQPACPSAAPSADEAVAILDGVTGATVRTNKGEFRIELYGEAAPLATANFVALARCGFYDGISFHRVIPGFVIQAGDPQTRNNHGDFDGLGSGSPGYRFEVETPPAGLRYEPYVVAMANSERWNESGEVITDMDSNGSQFFVALDDLEGRWPVRIYTIFGHVTDGTDVVDAIAQLPTSEFYVPLDPAIIETIEIVSGVTDAASPNS